MATHAEQAALAAAAEVVEAPATRGTGDNLIKLGSNILVLLGKASELRDRLVEAGARDKLQAVIADAAALKDILQDALGEAAPTPDATTE